MPLCRKFSKASRKARLHHLRARSKLLGKEVDALIQSSKRRLEEGSDIFLVAETVTRAGNLMLDKEKVDLEIEELNNDKTATLEPVPLEPMPLDENYENVDLLTEYPAGVNPQENEEVAKVAEEEEDAEEDAEEEGEGDSGEETQLLSDDSVNIVNGSQVDL